MSKNSKAGWLRHACLGLAVACRTRPGLGKTPQAAAVVEALAKGNEAHFQDESAELPSDAAEALMFFKKAFTELVVFHLNGPSEPERNLVGLKESLLRDLGEAGITLDKDAAPALQMTLFGLMPRQGALAVKMFRLRDFELGYLPGDPPWAVGVLTTSVPCGTDSSVMVCQQVAGQ